MRLSIAGLLDGLSGLRVLVLLLGESDAEQPEEVSVGGLDVCVSLDEGLPFLDHGAKLVGREVHAVELGEAVLALHILADQLEFPKRPLGILKGVRTNAIKIMQLCTSLSNLHLTCSF